MFDLYAIGIYVESNGALIRDSSSVQKSLVYNEFKNLDHTLFKTARYSTMVPSRVIEDHPEDEFNTFYKCRYKMKSNPDVFGNAVFAISSRNILTFTEKDSEGNSVVNDKETHYLFRNIRHILEKHPVAIQKGATLNDVLKNPFRYTGRDLVLGIIDDNIASVLVTQVKTLGLVSQRPERLASLEKKIDELGDGARIWVDTGKRAKRSCCRR